MFDLQTVPQWTGTETLLHLAVQKCRPFFLREALRVSTIDDIQRKDPRGVRPFDYAVRSGLVESAEMLWRAQAVHVETENGSKITQDIFRLSQIC